MSGKRPNTAKPRGGSTLWGKIQLHPLGPGGAGQILSEKADFNSCPALPLRQAAARIVENRSPAIFTARVDTARFAASTQYYECYVFGHDRYAAVVERFF